MSYAEGLQIGYRIASDAGQQLREGYAAGQKKKNAKAIGEALTRDYSFEDEIEPTPQAVQQRVQQGADETSAIQGLAGAITPEAPPSQGLGIPQMPQGAQPQQMPGLMQGNVLATAAQAAGRTPEQATAEVTPPPRKRANPMQDYLRYQEAAQIAAKSGDLDLQKAYNDMSQAAFKNGTVAFAFQAVNALKNGDATGVQRFLTNVVPDGYRYENFRADPATGKIVGEVVGEGGARSPYEVSEDSILQSAQALLTSPDSIDQLYKARVEADKTRWDRQKDVSEMRIKEGQLSESARRNDIMEAGMLLRGSGGAGGAGGRGLGNAAPKDTSGQDYDAAVKRTGSPVAATFYMQIDPSVEPGMRDQASRKFAAGDFAFSVDPATGRVVQETKVGNRTVQATTPGGTVRDPLGELERMFPGDAGKEKAELYKQTVLQHLRRPELHRTGSLQGDLDALPPEQRSRVIAGLRKRYGDWVIAAGEQAAPQATAREPLRPSAGLFGGGAMGGDMVQRQPR